MIIAIASSAQCGAGRSEHMDVYHAPDLKIHAGKGSHQSLTLTMMR